jgi:hypothetical protein
MGLDLAREMKDKSRAGIQFVSTGPESLSKVLRLV